MDDLELIKEKISIVDLIQEHLPLKKAGINFKANCPFHQEKTASFFVSPERRIWHCFGCFPPGELVKTPFGYHPIEEINEEHWVVSGKANLRRVTETMVHQFEGFLIKITLRKLAYEVKLTPDHNVFVVRGAPYTRKKYKDFSKRYRKYLKLLSTDKDIFNKAVKRYFPIKKIPAGELEQGDLLLFPINRAEKNVEVINLADYISKHTKLGPVPKKIPLQIPVDGDLLKLIGYWIAEGSNHRGYIRFSLGNHEEDFAQEIIKLIKKIFGLEAKIYRRPSLTKTGIEITACHSQLADVFENFCGKGAVNKHIPFIFQELPHERQKILLDAIFRGDGTSFIVNRSKKQHKSITTISKILSEQITDILLRLNLFPTVFVGKQHIDKLQVNHRQSYTIFWSEEAIQKYNLIYYQSDGSEHWLLPISKLSKEYYRGPVHNFTVEEDHSYIATSFAVANCQKGGDIFKFLMEKEGLDFKEALQILAKKAGITLKRSGLQKDSHDRPYEVNLKAQEFFHHILIKHSLGKNALEYLKKRGLTGETIETFGLGYAPNSWESLTKFLLKRGFKVSEIVAAGLAVPARDSCYDRFRGRITFPMFDAKDRLIAFSGRVLYPIEPKYINTPQTPIFDKSKFLFGLHLSKSEVRNKKEAVLVEGEMDMILSFQAGVKNVVASKGTALTEGQIELLKKYTDTLNLCFDMDLAGDSASRRGIEMADKAGMNLKVTRIPQGKDAAELVKEDPSSWKKAVEEATPIYDYYLGSVASRFNSKDPAHLRQIGAELIPVWAKISDDLVREHYIQKLAAFLKTDEKVIRLAVSKARTSGSQGFSRLVKISSQDNYLKNPKTRRELLEEYLIALLLHVPIDLDYVPNFPETLFTEERWKQVYVLLVLYLDSTSFKRGSFKINEFVAGLPAELVKEVDRLYLSELDEKLSEKESWQKELNKVVSELKKALIKASLEKLSLEIKNAQEFGKMEVLEVLNRRFRDLSVKLKNLS